MNDRSRPDHSPSPRPRRRSVVLSATVLLLASACSSVRSESPPADPIAGSSPHSKLNRQIDIFERMVDDVLIDSHHALVSRGPNANGAYLPGFGAVFTIEFSLVGPFWGGNLMGVGDGHFRFHVFDDDLGILYYDDESISMDDDEDDDRDRDERDRDRERSRRRVRIRRSGDDSKTIELDDEDIAKHRTRQYVRVKEELIDALGEYGDVLDALAGDEWVAIVARPSELSWGERKIKRLVIRARKRDIAERAENRIDAAGFAERVVVEEYR